MAKARTWIRLYTEVPDNPKLQKLSAEVAWFWVNCLCLAGRNDEGWLPSIDDISWHRRQLRSKTESMLAVLIKARLIDEVDGRLRPHDFNARQFEADISTDRVKQFRERRMKRRETVSETANETVGNGFMKPFPSVSVSVSDSVLDSKKKKVAISDDFRPFWTRWCEVTGRRQKEADACMAWVGVVEPDAAPLAMACLERYAKSGEVARGIVSNADKWIYEQARDHWSGDWPGPRSTPPSGGQSSRVKNALAEALRNAELAEPSEAANGQTDGSSSGEITWKALIADGAFSRRSRSAEGSGAYSHASRAGCGIGGESGRRAA